MRIKFFWNLIFLFFLLTSNSLSRDSGTYPTDDKINNNGSKGNCSQGDCANGIGIYLWSSGTKYAGEFKNYRPHGQGTYTWIDGTKYIGELLNNKRHGQGTYKW